MKHRTALHSEHERLNARLVDFAGWEMPIQYDSATAEHMAVRESAGVFDVGHMGRFYIQGKGAGEALERILACRVLDMEPGRVRYTVVCNHGGGVLDDVLATRLTADLFLVVVNASNRETLLPWFEGHLGGDARLTDHTMETGMIAIQGPLAEKITAKLVEADVGPVKYYHAIELAGGIMVSRTGYTGEDGFELIADRDKMPGFWRAAIEAGAKPAGLAARDSLRLEAGYPLYGHELAEDITPLEAGLKWAIALDKEGFIGRAALDEQLAAGVPRRRIAFTLEERGIPRQGYPIYDGDDPIGAVTSGGHSPVLKRGIGMGLVDAAKAKPAALAVEIRGKRVPAAKTKTPFVSAGKA